MISTKTHKIKRLSQVTPNAYKTRFFVGWDFKLTRDECLKGLSKWNTKGFDTEEEAIEFRNKMVTHLA